MRYFGAGDIYGTCPQNPVNHSDGVHSKAGTPVPEAVLCIGQYAAHPRPLARTRRRNQQGFRGGKAD
eukprot:1237470-Rhodomonas_salina.1